MEGEAGGPGAGVRIPPDGVEVPEGTGACGPPY